MATMVRPRTQAAPPARRLRLGLHRKQGLAFQSRATEILYGGAAGGGKSHLMRVAAIAWCMAIPGLQVYIFRRILPDLIKNHMEGPSSFPVLLGPLVEANMARIVWGNQMKIRFANGSVIHLSQCQHEKDVYKYQGAEIHVLMIDELTHWTRKMYLFLRSRVRMVGLTLPPAYEGLFPRIVNGSNPGNIGHNWVKQDFVSNAPAMAIVRMPKPDGGMLRQYIPARMSDNPTLLRDDPEYEDKLEGLGDPALVRAMREGDWDIVAGGMFDDVWKSDVHAIEPFRIPDTWYVDRSFDWGSSKPFSIGWWAESDGTYAKMPDGTLRNFPRGTLFRIAEWYGWNGTPNEGLKMLASDIADGIIERETNDWVLAGHAVQPGPADPSINDTENGNCIADDMEARGVTWTDADNSPGSRKQRWLQIRARLTAAKEQRPESPGLYVFNTCTQFVRTVPVLPRDERNRDDVDTNSEDHIGDESGYRALASAGGGWGSSSFSA